MALATRSLSAFASRVHGEVERGVAHGGLGGARRDAVLGEVHSELMAQRVDAHRAAPLVFLLDACRLQVAVEDLDKVREQASASQRGSARPANRGQRLTDGRYSDIFTPREVLMRRSDTESGNQNFHVGNAVK